jgi:hypothetical protein
MPRFRFVAADSTGQVTDGTIDAATQSTARNMLASNGLAVRELEEVAASGPAPPALPRRVAAKSAGAVEPVEPLPMTRARKAERVEVAGRGSRAPLVLSILALVIALAAGAYVVYRDPPWGRLSRYDFRTAEKAYLSHLRIEATGDIQAMIELQRKAVRKQMREKLDTVQVQRNEEFRGKRILFIEYQQDGSRRREIAYFEPDADRSNEWKPTFISDDEIRSLNPALADKIAQWRQTVAGPRFGPAGGHDW